MVSYMVSGFKHMVFFLWFLVFRLYMGIYRWICRHIYIYIYGFLIYIWFHMDIYGQYGSGFYRHGFWMDGQRTTYMALVFLVLGS